MLRPGGLLTFTTFGPDTLVELRRAWAAADGHAHVNRFIDMHDLGDALVRAGLAEPVLDVERYTLTYAEVRDLMRDLKAIGAHNANAGRPRGLTGKGALAKMTDAYEPSAATAAAGHVTRSCSDRPGVRWGPFTAGRRGRGEGPGGEDRAPDRSRQSRPPPASGRF